MIQTDKYRVVTFNPSGGIWTVSLLLSAGILTLASFFTYAVAEEQWVPPPSVNKLMDSSDSGYDLRQLSNHGNNDNKGNPYGSGTERNSSVLDNVAHPSKYMLELRSLRKDNRNLQKTTKDKIDENVMLRKRIEALTSQLSGLNNSLIEMEKKLSDSQSDISTMHKQAADSKKLQESAASQVQDLTTKLTLLNEKLASRFTVISPDTDAQRQAYVVGQAMAVGLRTKLDGYSQAGVKLDQESVIAGLTDGLTDRMQLTKMEMDKLWIGFSDKLQTQIDARIKESEEFLLKKTIGRKPVLSADGFQYFSTKKGQNIKDNNMPRVLSLTESNATDQRVISQVPHLVLGNEDEMPIIIRDALPLLGPGAEIEVYAIAHTVYGDRPLPKGVTPFSILHYRMRGLESTTK